MGFTSPKRASLGLFTGLPDALVRPEWLHALTRFHPTELRKRPEAVVAVEDKQASRLLELPSELLAQIVDHAFWLRVRTPPTSVEEQSVGQMKQKNRQPIALYIDDSVKQKKRRDAVFTSSRERAEVFNQLALVCKAFIPHARRAFHNELSVTTTDGIDTLAKQYNKDPGLARAVRVVRIRGALRTFSSTPILPPAVGMVLRNRQEHPSKRQAQLASILSEMEYIEHLECSRLPSPRRHPAFASASFTHLRALDLEAPPSYYHLRPAFDNMKQLKKLHLFLFSWESSPEEFDQLAATPPPPFQLDDFILLLKPESRVNPTELLHLLSSSEAINKLGLQLRVDKPPLGAPRQRPDISEVVFDVVRAIMEKYLAKVVDLSLAAQFTSLMQETALANPPAEALEPVASN